MNLRYALSILPLLSLLTGSAQYSLTTGNSVPNAGDVFPLRTVDAYVYEGNAGPDQEYKHWQLLLPSTGNRNTFYIAATSSMPSATLASTDGGSDTAFWSVTSAGLVQVGVRGSLEGLLTFTDPLVELALPLAYGEDWTDATTASYSVSGIPVTRVGSIRGEADAHGSLELSLGALYPEVLRVKVRREITDNSAFLVVRRIANIHYYYTESYTHPVLKLLQDSVQTGAGSAWQVTRKAEWIGAPGGVGVTEIDPNDFTFTAYPNPANDALTLTFEANARPTHVELFDAKGQLVATQQVNATTILLDVKGLATGLYTVRSMNDATVLGSRTVVVN